MLTYLRVAATVVCLAACVAMIVLSVRSYHTVDCPEGPLIGTQGFSVTSDQGRLILSVFTGGSGLEWQVSTVRFELQSR